MVRETLPARGGRDRQRCVSTPIIWRMTKGARVGVDAGLPGGITHLVLRLHAFCNRRLVSLCRHARRVGLDPAQRQAPSGAAPILREAGARAYRPNGDIQAPPLTQKGRIRSTPDTAWSCLAGSGERLYTPTTDTALVTR